MNGAHNIVDIMRELVELGILERNKLEGTFVSYNLICKDKQRIRALTEEQRLVLFNCFADNPSFMRG